MQFVLSFQVDLQNYQMWNILTAGMKLFCETFRAYMYIIVNDTPLASAPSFKRVEKCYSYYVQ